MPSSKAEAKLAVPAGRTAGKVARPAASATFVGVKEEFQRPVAIKGTQLYLLDPQERIAVIRQGIDASMIGNLSLRMGMSKENLLSSLGLSRATISRKEKDATLLSKDESERVLGVETLIGMVQTMVEQSGDPSRLRRRALGVELAVQTAAGAGRRDPGQLHGHVRGAEAGGRITLDEPERGIRMTVAVWRIALEAPTYTADDLSGTGAKISGGRWNSKGTPLVYSASNIALATIETVALPEQRGAAFQSLSGADRHT